VLAATAVMVAAVLAALDQETLLVAVLAELAELAATVAYYYFTKEKQWLITQLCREML
jgi:hypothetical protein